MSFLTGLAGGTTSYRPTDRARLGVVLTELLTAVLTHHLDDQLPMPPETRDRALYLRSQAFVRQHLGDPALTPEAVAAAHHVSLRHLQRVFQRNGQTVAGSIRAQRLEHARRDLADPALRHRPVRTLAARWGHPDPAVFARAFRATYGRSPRDYRRQFANAPDASGT